MRLVKKVQPSASAIVEPPGERRVLLLRRRYPPSAGFWAFPGGRMENGESFEACARREVQEETGLDVELGPLLGVFRWPARVGIHPSPVQYQIHCFRASYRGGEPRANPESLELRWFTEADLDGLPVTRTTWQALRKAGYRW